MLARISKRQAIDAYLDAEPRLPVAQPREPHVETFGRPDLDHEDDCDLWFTICQPQDTSLSGCPGRCPDADA